MEIETRRVGAHAIAPAAQQPMQRQARLLCREVPQGHLHRLVERQAESALVAAARPVDPMDERKRRLAFQAGPDLGL